jgi:hypothetical protein
LDLLSLYIEVSDIGRYRTIGICRVFFIIHKLLQTHIPSPGVNLFGNAKVDKCLGFLDSFNRVKFIGEKIQKMAPIPANDLD